MSDGKISAAEKPKISRVEVYWHTVRYRTVVLYAVVILAIILASTYLVFPETSASLINKITDKIAPRDTGVATITARQARFVNLDGKVQVKKASSVSWANADYQITLDKGDLIQTGPEGVARVAFADGTTYTVKGDTLVTVEENVVAQDRPTSVGVHISSGQVDLATGTWEVPGSKAEVSFENAVASLRENTRAAVRSDPQTQQQEITVASGSAQLDRGSQHLDIGQWERASFPTGGAVTKTDVLAPPDLQEPKNLQPLIVADPKTDPIHFSWKPVSMAKMYQFQVSTTTMFNHVVMDRKVAAPSVDISGLDPGDYFWRVIAIDEKNNVSDPSNSFKFILAAQGKEQEMLLEVDNTELHGNNVEISGRTEPGAALIINGQQVADIRPDGHFHYFTAPMARGSHEIVITGQNRRGGTAIKRVEVVVP
jgi:FecR protein